MALAAGLGGLVLGFLLGRIRRRAPRPVRQPDAPEIDYGLTRQLDVIRNARFGSLRTTNFPGRETNE